MVPGSLSCDMREQALSAARRAGSCPALHARRRPALAMTYSRLHSSSTLALHSREAACHELMAFARRCHLDSTAECVGKPNPRKLRMERRAGGPLGNSLYASTLLTLLTLHRLEPRKDILIFNLQPHAFYKYLATSLLESMIGDVVPRLERPRTPLPRSAPR